MSKRYFGMLILWVVVAVVKASGVYLSLPDNSASEKAGLSSTAFSFALALPVEACEALQAAPAFPTNTRLTRLG